MEEIEVLAASVLKKPKAPFNLSTPYCIEFKQYGPFKSESVDRRFRVALIRREPQFLSIDLRYEEYQSDHYRIPFMFTLSGTYQLLVNHFDTCKRLIELTFVVSETDCCAFRWGSQDSMVACMVPEPMENLGMLTISKISTGASHTVLITDIGAAFGYGDNSKGQLGQDPKTVPQITTPTEIPSFRAKNAVQVSCARVSTSILIEGGDVFSFGDGSTKITHVESLKRHHISDLTCAFGMHVGLSLKGDVFLWKSTADTPSKDEYLSQHKVRAISGNFTSLLVLVSDGSVYEGVFDHYYKRANWKKVQIPTYNEKNELPNIKDVTNKGAVKMMLTEDGKLITWNQTKVPAIGRLGVTGTPSFVPRPAEKFTSIGSGRAHMAALNESGQIYVWGEGSRGQLGFGDTKEKEEPTLVSSIKQKIYSILLSGDETIAIVRSPQSRLGESILSILEDGRYSDLTLITQEGKEIKVHKAIIWARCPGLLEMLGDENEGKVKIPYKNGVVQPLLQYLYSDRLNPISGGDLEELWSLAKRFGLERLRQSLKPEDFNKKVESTLKEDLANLVGRKEFSDFKLILPETEEGPQTILYVHKCLLSRSEYFRRLFDSGMKESQEGSLVMSNVEEETARKLMEWTYTDQVGDISVDTCLELIQVANEYAAEDRLKDLCTSFVIKEMDVETVCYVYEIARISNSFRLKTACLEMIKSEWTQVQKTETYENLSPESLQEIKSQI